jgi:hypothetical protein
MMIGNIERRLRLRMTTKFSSFHDREANASQTKVPLKDHIRVGNT